MYGLFNARLVHVLHMVDLSHVAPKGDWALVWGFAPSLCS